MGKPESVFDQLSQLNSERELQSLIIKNLKRIPFNGRFLTLIPGSLPDGSEFSTSAGPIDIFAKDDEGTFYVIETKHPPGKDTGVAQILRYWGAIRASLGPDAKIVGYLVAPGFEKNTELAASVVPNFFLMDSRTDVLPYCQEVTILNGKEVPLHKIYLGLGDNEDEHSRWPRTVEASIAVEGSDCRITITNLFLPERPSYEIRGDRFMLGNIFLGLTKILHCDQMDESIKVRLNHNNLTTTEPLERLIKKYFKTCRDRYALETVSA